MNRQSCETLTSVLPQVWALDVEDTASLDKKESCSPHSALEQASSKKLTDPIKAQAQPLSPPWVLEGRCAPLPPFLWWLIFLPMHTVSYSDIKLGQPPPCQPFLELWQSFQKPAYPCIFAISNCASTAIHNPPFAMLSFFHLTLRLRPLHNLLLVVSQSIC